jgi:hypothetical protein
VQHVGADPDQQVPDTGQHEELLKDEVVQCEQAGLKHGEQVKVPVLLGKFVVALVGNLPVPLREEVAHAHTHYALTQTQQADETTLITMKDGGV